LRSQIVVELECSHARSSAAEEVGAESRTRADLEHVVAQVSGLENPRKQVGLQHLRPVGAGQELQMEVVHAASLADCVGNKQIDRRAASNLREQPPMLLPRLRTSPCRSADATARTLPA